LIVEPHTSGFGLRYRDRAHERHDDHRGACHLRRQTHDAADYRRDTQSASAMSTN
jgi:hypothetical protein